MQILKPMLEKAQITTKSLGKLVIGTVEGDIPDISKNLVSSMLSTNGFDVIGLGADGYAENAMTAVTEAKKLIGTYSKSNQRIK